MTRLIAGSAKGQPLKVPPSGTRPTSDRVRESIFSSLEHIVGQWSGVRFLDLYAGSGAVGLEALSRGAEFALLVESSRAASDVIAANIDQTGLPASLIRKSVAAYLEGSAPSQPFTVVFCDPPYEVATAEVSLVLARLSNGGFIGDDSIVIIERSSRSEPIEWPAGFETATTRKFGDTAVSRAIWYVAGEAMDETQGAPR